MRWKEESPATAEAMGIQTLVVFIAGAAALGVGLLTAGSAASLRAAGFIALGFAVRMWAVTYLIEELIGPDIRTTPHRTHSPGSVSRFVESLSRPMAAESGSAAQ
jgi:hypothetical protein